MSNANNGIALHEYNLPLPPEPPDYDEPTDVETISAEPADLVAATDPEEEFWNTRPVLQHVRDFARGRRVCPWSTLGVVLVRALCHLPPHVYLPPIIGGRTAPNLFCALVGPSGVGKGASEAAGRDAIVYGGRDANGDPYLKEFPLGSGEGVARIFSGDDGLPAALFTASEIDSLGALFSRQGSTLEGTLRQVFMGETLGFTNAQKNTRTYVESLTYRAGVIVGVQPLRSQTLLNGADGGTPQRFLWMPVRDKHRPADRPETPEPIAITIPDYLPGDLIVTRLAWQAIDAHQAAVHHEEPGVDPLDGHANLTRVKVAVSLMVLDGRREVSDEDWRLAGVVMDVSKWTRERCRRAIAEQFRRANTARALAVAERDEVISDRRLDRAKQAILRKLDDGQPQPRNLLRSSLKADLRPYFDPAAEELAQAGELAITAGMSGSQKVQVYQRYRAENQPFTSDDKTCTPGTGVPDPLDLATARLLAAVAIRPRFNSDPDRLRDVICNKTVQKHYKPALKQCLDRGWLRAGTINGRKGGYTITDKGRSHLARSQSSAA
jgi:hypothetical protein